MRQIAKRMRKLGFISMTGEKTRQAETLVKGDSLEITFVAGHSRRLGGTIRDTVEVYLVLVDIDSSSR